MTDDELLAEARAIVVQFRLVPGTGMNPITDAVHARGLFMPPYDGLLLVRFLMKHFFEHMPLIQETLNATRTTTQ